MKRDVHMEALKWARDNPGFTIEEFCVAFVDDFGWLEREILHSKVFQTDKNTSEPGHRYYLSFDDRFKLLEHEELKDARKSSKLAFRLAIASIVIALVGIGIQQCSVSRVEVINLPGESQTSANNKSLKCVPPASLAPPDTCCARAA